MTPEAILKERFGHNSFRPLQEEAIRAITDRRDLLMILPTGGGKSLSFQLPTLMMEGTTVVISPLIALMQDQVQALNAQQMRAAMLSSAQRNEENNAVITALLSGTLEFLYISPERLNTPKMLQILHQIRINFFVIDEAHCISEWGHEFRDDYRALSQLKQNFPGVNIAAFTATATLHVRDDIVRLLQLERPVLLQGSIYRPNLNITVSQRIKRGYERLLEFLASRTEQNGIIYMPSRKKCEELAEYLNQRGFNARFYHAGMNTEARNAVFKAFVFDEVRIVVATIAFGMGIDKSDIRYVVHMSMPKTLENYYQEIGRAGRDGESAEVLLLYSAEDMVYAKMRLDEIENESYRRHLHEKLSSMYRYVSAEECRHRFIARYFENEIAPCEDACDNCLAGEIEKQEITTEAQKLLSAIYRTGQRFGKTYIVDVLRGSTNQKILQNGHDTLSVYGIGETLHKNQWLVIVDRLLELEQLKLGEYQVLQLSESGIETLKGKQSVFIAAERMIVKKRAPKATPVHETGDFDTALFERLRSLRSETAQELGVPAYIVFGDKTLKEMARLKPSTKEELLAVNGVGERKFEQFGEVFLFAITAHG